MTADKTKRATISVLGQTKDSLDLIKHQGQSYDGLIQELVRFWQKGHGLKKSP